VKVGDLVRSIGIWQGTPLLLGIIIEQLENLPIGLGCYKVMLEDGQIVKFTSASLRKVEAVNESR